MRRVAVKAVAIAAFVAAAVVGAGYAYVRRSLPAFDGTVQLAGISRPIEIVRDADAVPHIFAATRLEALFGLGYVHAQDRLWQMEFQRRIGHGRLSEVFGEVTLKEDRFLRTVGFGRAARTAWTHLPSDAREQVEAYVAGVNAFMTSHHGARLPPEFSLLRYEPEPWSGPDVLAWVKMMAWDLSANYSFELLRHDMLAAVGARRTGELLPPYPEDGLSIIGTDEVNRWLARRGRPAPAQGPLEGRRDRVTDSGRPQAADGSWSASFSQALSGGLAEVRALLLGNATTEALGSNNWVVDGTLTASGKPLLANDPHLGTHVPSLWYLVHLSTPDFDVIGATLPGTPAVAIGRNRFIAWGETNLGADVEDLFLERLDATGQAAEYRGIAEPLHVIPETIHIKGREPARITVRVSRHGPLVSDAINANNATGKGAIDRRPLEPLALRWTALDAEDTTIVTFLELMGARNWSEFTAALRHFRVPSQNFVYADVDGHIGYYAPGRIPIRGRGDGSRPAQGWTGEAEWVGWIPFDELPHVLDPPRHVIVTANNRPAAPPYPHVIALEYPQPYRARRIVDLLSTDGRLTPEDFRTIQADTRSLHAAELLPLLLRKVQTRDALDNEALELLRRWSLDARGDSAAAAIFEAWFLRLGPELAGDKLGPLVMKAYEGRFSHLTRFIVNALTSDDARWCDDQRTPQQETCSDAVTKALHAAVASLARQLGGDPSRWRWDGVHRAVFPHQGLDAVGLLRPLLSRAVPNGGDWSTVDVGAVDVDHPFEQRSVPGYRQIIDLSPANDSRFIDAVGQSGHFLSPHYDDFLKDWHDVRHRRMRIEREDIERGAIGHLRLVPAP